MKEIKYDEHGNIVCPDCMAHYTKGYNHICPPWLKYLVGLNKKKNAKNVDNQNKTQ